MSESRLQDYHTALVDLCQKAEDDRGALQTLTRLFFVNLREVLRIIPYSTRQAGELIRVRSVYRELMNLIDYGNPAFVIDRTLLIQVAGLLYLWLDTYSTPNHGEKAEIERPG